CDEAIRLTRVLAQLMPDEAEVFGLLALMLLTSSRRGARVDGNGELVLLADQDRSLWSSPMIEEGLAIVRALLKRNQPGPYQIQAAINAVHASAPTAAATEWSQILASYDQLLALTPTPVVAMNRAVAVAEVHGPALALAALEPVADALDGYHPFHVARADFLRRLDRIGEALAEYDAALACVGNDGEREFLQKKRAALTA
ncbi:MAG: polymerase sigma-70 factor, subfamily, partial [Actinomycetota bacterium]